MKIAMWSGPRNLSTALMYSFGNRTDFDVVDEPFYAAYLSATETDHPLKAEIIAAGQTDPEKAISAWLETDSEHSYMKHMSHHMLAGFPLNWAKECTNIHLIRHPARVVASYAAKREHVTFEDIGFRQQAEIFEKLGGIVLDSFDIRSDPKMALSGLCASIGLPFDKAMLNWPKGGHINDGVWASHWYGAVHQSTGFAGPEGPLPILSKENEKLVSEALPYYEHMKKYL